MQNFYWKEKYTGVYVRWCIGYLSDLELVQFLENAALRLDRSTRSRTRGATPTSLIFVIDQVAPPSTTLGPFDLQITRNEHHIEKLFKRAKLKV